MIDYWYDNIVCPSVCDASQYCLSADSDIAINSFDRSINNLLGKTCETF